SAMAWASCWASASWAAERDSFIVLLGWSRWIFHRNARQQTCVQRFHQKSRRPHHEYMQIGFALAVSLAYTAYGFPLRLVRIIPLRLGRGTYRRGSPRDGYCSTEPG